MKSRTLLLTGFGLWGEERYNTSWETIRDLKPELPSGWTVIRERLPVEWDRGPQSLIDRLDPSIGAVVCFGMCGGDRIRPERLAVNLADPSLRDAQGTLTNSDLLDENGAPAWFTGFDYPRLIASLRDGGLPTAESRDAGGFLCNKLFYTLMQARARMGASFPAGFIHLPHFETEGGLPAPVLKRAAAICIRHALEQAIGADQGPAM
jgi:pyroglutamyl-peptidase